MRNIELRYIVTTKSQNLNSDVHNVHALREFVANLRDYTNTNDSVLTQNKIISKTHEQTMDTSNLHND